MRFSARHWLLLLLAVCLLAASVRLFRGKPRPAVRFTEADCARIKDGMTEAQVTALLGMPPGDYSTRNAAKTASPLSRPGGDEESFTKEWISDEGFIAVEFDNDGKVKGAVFGTAAPAELSWWDRVQGWLGL
jgi:outer membrane protein assembly factor BamE (lipoprotein component of BamABCDE complex)